MTSIYSLCSSSKGNCTYIGDQSKGILIDCGIGIRIFTNYMQTYDIAQDALQAIFITHEHTDHIKGLSAILKKWNVPVYASRETLEELVAKDAVSSSANLNEINKRSVCYADMEISAFTTPHDSVHSLGYKLITNEQKQACICTDLGYMPDEVYDNLKGSDFVLLESNYDETMLKMGGYPYFLKQRILSESGHLSNENCTHTLKRLINDGTTNFLLGHLSEQNNLPHLALSSAVDGLSEIGAIHKKDYTLSVAPVRSTGAVVNF